MRILIMDYIKLSQISSILLLSFILSVPQFVAARSIELTTELLNEYDAITLYNLSKEHEGLYNEKRIRLIEASANKGYVDAQYEFGEIKSWVYNDEQQAFDWFVKAAEQGHIDAHNEISAIYYFGYLGERDLAKAIEYAQKAVDLGETDMRMLKDFTWTLRCYNASSVQLFQYKLNCLTRSEFELEIKRSGGTKLRAHSNNFKENGEWIRYDSTFDSAKLLEGSSTLHISYLNRPNSSRSYDVFAKAVYTFDSHVDTQQVKRIADMVASKYGQPDSINGQINVGPISFVWMESDGIRIIVSREWPDTTTYLTFLHPANYQALTQKIEKYEKQKLDKKYKTQSDAF